MSTPNPDDPSKFLADQIQRAKALRLEHKKDAQRAAKRQILRQWQADRLAHTYADLLADPGCRPAAEFFLSDLYGLKDTTTRDANIERIYSTMVRLLPVAALHSIGLAIELDALSEELDLELLDVLVDQLRFKDQLTQKMYVEAYRRCDNYDQRKHQIELIRQVGEDLSAVVKKPLVATMLRTMRKPAQFAGFGELQEFLDRGFSAFEQLKDPARFLDTIERRETQILERIHSGAPEPFAIANV